MTWENVRDALEIAVIVWGFISGGIVLYLRGTFVTRRLFELEVKRLDLAVASCRTSSVGETKALEMSLERLNGVLGRLDERTVSLKDGFGKLSGALERIEDFLLAERSGPGHRP